MFEFDMFNVACGEPEDDIFSIIHFRSGSRHLSAAAGASRRKRVHLRVVGESEFRSQGQKTIVNIFPFLRVALPSIAGKTR
jgi:hypothetical protein